MNIIKKILNYIGVYCNNYLNIGRNNKELWRGLIIIFC